MPFALVIIGLVLLVASVRNTQSQLFTMVQGDFTGPNNFVYWFLAMIIIGSIGYVPKLKAFSNAMLGLVIVVLFLKKGTGFFAQFQQAISTTQIASALSSSGITNVGAASTGSLLSAFGASGSLLTGSTGILGTGSVPSSGVPILINNTGTSTGTPTIIGPQTPAAPGQAGTPSLTGL